MTTLLLGALGLTLSLLVPDLLAGARWTARVPAAAVLLWQSLTLAAVLCAVGVVLAAPEELVRLRGSARPVAAVALLGALAVAAAIVLRLLGCLAGVSYRSRARRARHRLLVDLLDRAERHGEFEAVAPGTLRVLDGPTPFAYCLPGRSPRVVLSDGALRALRPEEVAAVLAHEQAHLRWRHEWVMESFTAFYRAVPRPLRSRTPLDAVHLLLEMVADDVARRDHSAESLRTALITMSESMASTYAPDDEATAGPDAAVERRRRLDRLGPQYRPGGRGLTLTVVVTAAAILVLPTVAVVVPWLNHALRAWPL